tara:strand:- start:6832 stop:8475 length:1644 start_codon:yes stop_codon:yes gene_type:complete
METQTIITSNDQMDDAVSTITRSGASGPLLADFKAIGEATASDGSTKYSHAPVMVWLAKFIVGSAGGPHKDAPIFELCHLVSAIDALSEGGSDERALFFLGVEKALPAVYRAALDEKLEFGDWLKPGFERTENGIGVYYDDDGFEVRFGRMPFLAALYEFLTGLDNYDFYTELNEIFDDLSQASIDLEAIKTASNRISARLRKYRREHLTRAQHDEKFDRIFGFLKARENAGERDGQICIDDPAVLDFWLEFSTVGEFRAYKTVFDGFVNFMRALEEADQQDTIENAAIIGTDFEAQEIEPDDQSDGLDGLGDWQSPLNILDAEPANQIKFFKKEGERKPIEALMQYGPYAGRLPRSFMQLEVFGSIQTAITTDLQVKRGETSVRQRLDCRDAMAYDDKREQFQTILAHVRQLQKATYFVLAGQDAADLGDNIVAFGAQNPDSVFEAARHNDNLDDIEMSSDFMADAVDAFSKLTRKGFNEDMLEDPDGIEGFRMGAGALLSISGQLETFLTRMAALDKDGEDLNSKFDQDKQVFSNQFNLLYGDVQ